MRYAVRSIISDPAYCPETFCESRGWKTTERGREQVKLPSGDIWDDLNRAHAIASSNNSIHPSGTPIQWYYIVEECP